MAMKMALRQHDRVERLAVYGSGLGARHASRHFVSHPKRCFKIKNLYHTMIYRRRPKLAVSVDCDTHLVVPLATMGGPNSGLRHIEQVVEHAWLRED